MGKGSARRIAAITAPEWDAAWLRIFAENDDDASRAQPEPVLEGDDVSVIKSSTARTEE